MSRGFLVLTVVAVAHLCAGAGHLKRPNIVFILADDLATDPGEKQDLQESRPEDFRQLKELYSTWIADVRSYASRDDR
jgi:hypothetical protein